MKMPDDIDLPFFTYGVFKPGQLGFLQIADKVEAWSAAKVEGSFWIRDGLPFIDTTKANNKVPGALIQFEEPDRNTAYEQINAFEPWKLYYWAPGGTNTTSGEKCNLLLGKSPKKGNASQYMDDYDAAKKDILLEDGPRLVKEYLDRAKKSQKGLPKTLLELQMAYLLLCAAIEHYVTLRHNLKCNPTEKYKIFAKDDAYKRYFKKYVDREDDVFAMNDLSKKSLSPDNPEDSIDYYYQLRNNITHQGKGGGGEENLRRLCDATSELLNIFEGCKNSAFDDSRGLAKSLKIEVMATSGHDSTSLQKHPLDPRD